MIGHPVRRKEDARLVTGRGAFGDDVNLPGQVHAAFVRSPHAHARLRAIDGAPTLDLRSLQAALAKLQLSEGAVFDILRRGRPMYLSVRTG